MSKPTEKKEVIICKFDNELECSSYLCEEDCSDLEMYLESGKTCPLFDKSEKLDVAVHNAKKILVQIQRNLDLDKISKSELKGVFGAEWIQFRVNRLSEALK